MYTVMGVTGKVGGATARALLAQGKRPRVVVRHRAKGESWAAQGCEVAIADLDDAEALGRAFEGAEAAFVMLPPLFDPSPDWREARAMIDTLRAALTRGAPKRVVALSTIGADAERSNLLSQLGLLERALSTLAMPVTFLRAVHGECGNRSRLSPGSRRHQKLSATARSCGADDRHRRYR
ncbi:NAD(P)H-binding protein [Bradyrhizobium sp. Leo170]|uniref:NAD(P)H-binding protein n=1 Tax=Bradyrhizobium sp. Leo170 TaxID=1571199 RepID=UPI0026C5D912